METTVHRKVARCVHRLIFAVLLFNDFFCVCLFLPTLTCGQILEVTNIDLGPLNLNAKAPWDSTYDVISIGKPPPF